LNPEKGQLQREENRGAVSLTSGEQKYLLQESSDKEIVGRNLDIPVKAEFGLFSWL
jgi:hypothetical protein